MESVSIKAKLGHVLVASKKNVPGKRNAGFLVDGVKCKGLLRTLKERFYSKFIAKNIKLRYTKRKNQTNGMRVGDISHKQVYHYFKCGNKLPNCVCPARFKGRKTSNIKPNTINLARITALERFLREAQWQVFDCELVAGFSERTKRIATAIDMVCVDSLLKPSAVYVVELKFGYARGIHDLSSKKAEFAVMSGPAGRSIPNTYANHHQLQLWFEMEAIKETYKIDCASGAVVYIRDDPPRAKKPRTATYHAEYAHSWWFKNEEKREALKRQLFSKEIKKKKI